MEFPSQVFKGKSGGDPNHQIVPVDSHVGGPLGKTPSQLLWENMGQTCKTDGFLILTSVSSKTHWEAFHLRHLALMNQTNCLK